MLASGSAQSTVNALSNNLGVMVAVATLNPFLAGLYVLSDRVVRFPINLIANNIRNYLAILSREQDRPNLRFVFVSSVILFSISTLGFAILWLGAKPLFRLAFGAPWERAGHVAAILAFTLVANFTALPFQSYIMSLRIYGTLLWIEVSVIAVRLITFGLFLSETTPELIAMIISVTTTVYYAAYIGIFLSKQRRGAL
jgi:O-antigen/teichoic acid export membrane protein